MRRGTWPTGGLVIGLGLVLGGWALHGPLPHWLAGPSHALISGPPARPHAVLIAILLLVLGWGLARGRLVAMVGTVLALGYVVVGVHHAWWGGFPVGVTAGLASSAHRFPTRPDRVALLTGLRNCALTLAAALLYGFASHHGLVARLDWGTAGLFIVLLTLVTLVRSAPAPEPADEADRARARRLVARPGADTLAPFVLRSDKSYVYSSDGRAVLGYRVLLGVAVVGGDPVGDPAAYGELVDRFVALCARRGWRPAVLGARADLVPLWRAHRLRGIGFGDEVVLDVGGFSLATRRMRNVRQAVRRTHNAGVTTRVVRAGDLSRPLLAELAELSARWLGSARERGFSMILDGLFDDRHPDALFVLAFADDGRLIGFQRYLPCGADATGIGGQWALSLDVMRRERGRINGLNERMIVDLVAFARANGVGTVSLNFAAFRELLDQGAHRTPAGQAGYRVLHLLDPLIQVESLYLFNAKFRPGYQPRSVLLDSWLGLPVIVAALLGLEFALPYDRHRDRQPVPSPVVAPEAGELCSARWPHGR